MQQRLAAVDWHMVAEQMHATGYALVPGLLTREDCQQIIACYDDQ